MIEPIGKSAQALVIERSEEYMQLASELFSRRIPTVDINFDLRGSSAGMFRVASRRCEIRYNPWLFAKYFDESLSSTVPHEIAHYVVHRLYGIHRVQAHGAEWQAVMAAFGADARVTGNYDLTGIPHRRQRRFAYHCECRPHALSTRCHNSIQQRRSEYLCRYCKGKLHYMGHEAGALELAAEDALGN